MPRSCTNLAYPGVGGPSGGFGGLPNIQTPPTGLGAATMGTPKPNGLGGFGGGLGGGFGGLGSGLGTAPKAPGIGLNAPTIAVNSFGTGLGSAAGASFGRRGGVKGIDLQMLPFFALILAVGDQYRSSQATNSVLGVSFFLAGFFRVEHF